jgi:flagellar biosynthetic protein FliP
VIPVVLVAGALPAGTAASADASPPTPRSALPSPATAPATADASTTNPPDGKLLEDLGLRWDSATSPEQLTHTLRLMATMTVLSLAPALLLMTTCYVRIVIVLSLLRQALGLYQLPSNQIINTVALFLTFLVMSPVWKRVHEEAIAPYTDPEVDMTLDEAWQAGVAPIRQFMSHQIDSAGNADDVWLFLRNLPEDTPAPDTYDQVPLPALLPAFLLSELKTAFLIGFQIYLPFVIVDLVVASVTISMGMFMLPPTTISLPLKLLLFVLVDGWHLIVGMLLESYAAVS